MNRFQIHQRRYLGAKTKLLEYIEEMFIQENVTFDTFFDLFAGTGVVGHYFNKRAKVYLNDILLCNTLSYHAFLGTEPIREELLAYWIDTFNKQDPSDLDENYFSENFADTYFSRDNCKRIGYIRERIEQEFLDGRLFFREKAYLITSLLYAMDRIANTVGHYDAYRKVKGLDRDIILRMLDTDEQANRGNRIYQRDANELVREISADIVYIDPPYNSRQYSDAYHLLENVAAWEKPEVQGVALKMERTHLKSRYNLKTAAVAFSDLIEHLKCKYIIVSYNDMGTNGCERSQARISDHEIVSALERRGKVTIYEKQFPQFTTGKSTKDDLRERLFFCRVEPEMKEEPVVLNITKPAESESIQSNHFAKSPLNYTGGKHRLLPKLIEYFPEDIRTFYDVFCGGANVGINAEADQIVCLDKSIELIDLLSYIQKLNFAELHQRIVSKIEAYGLSQSYIYGYSHYGCESANGLGSFNKTPFLMLRSDYNKAKSDEENLHGFPATTMDESNRNDIRRKAFQFSSQVETDTFEEKSLLLLLLIIYGFNNQIRFNSKGEFNLPVGKRDYNGNTRKHLSRFNELTNKKKISFQQGDFHSILSYPLTPKDFVYLDPPYLLGTASYNENGGWSDTDELALYNVLDALHERGIRFALSNVSEHKGRINTILLDWVKHRNYRIIGLDYNYNNSNYQSRAKQAQTQEIVVINYSKES